MKYQNTRMVEAMYTAMPYAVDVEAWAKRSELMSYCADTIEYKYCPDCGSIHLARAWLCRDRLCPVCAWRLSLKRAAEMQRVLLWLEARYDFVAEMLTLTVRNVAARELDETIKGMMRGWSNLTKRKSYRDTVVGFARSLEITRSKQGEYHPHYHVLLLRRSNRLIGQATWSDMWREVCGLPYQPIVHIERAYTKTTDGIKDYENISGAVIEALKYAVKSNVLVSIPSYDLPVISSALHGKRLVTYGGIISKARQALRIRNNNELNDLIEPLSVECPDCGASQAVLMGYRWCAQTASYVYEGNIEAAPKRAI